MAKIQRIPELNFLSELYAADDPDAQLLAEYPSSNSDDTDFQNKTKFIIHDPFPPPRKELLKILGPHHLMCGWGCDLEVTSQVAPSAGLLEHWKSIFGVDGCPRWKPFEDSVDRQFITLFPHESLLPEQQVVEPVANYAMHSKEVIEKIDCLQADVLKSVVPPCIVKLSHGYAGLGNFLIQSAADEEAMRNELEQHWPDSTLVVNSIIENIAADFGVQFYLRRDGSMVWLGFTEQHFNENKKWCGGTFSSTLQTELFDDLSAMIEPAGEYLHSQGYFGVVGIDILRDADKRHFLVDVNPRLTGITPFLIASRIFARDRGMGEGIYKASCCFNGSFEQLVDMTDAIDDAQVVVLSAFEDVLEDEGKSLADKSLADKSLADKSLADSKKVNTICHLSVTSESQERNQLVLSKIFPG